MKISESRDLRFLATAWRLAEVWSKDPSTRVASIVVGHEPNRVAWGYNGFPPGIEDTTDRLTNREWKNAHVLHAEQNAILNAVGFDPVTIYCTHFPCAERCALQIIGRRTIRRVVSIQHGYGGFNSRWGASMEHSMELFREAGISYTSYHMDDVRRYLATGEDGVVFAKD